MDHESGAPPRVPTGLHEFYGHFAPFKKRDGAPLRDFAPYQAEIWNDRFREHSSRHYLRSPGVGLTGLLLLEALNVVLASRRRANAMVMAADQFVAQRLRNSLLGMMEGSQYSSCIVREEEETDDIMSQTMHRGAGITVRPPNAAEGDVGGIAFESAIGFIAPSVSMRHVLVLDAMESPFPREKVREGMGNALSMAGAGGKAVVAMVPRAPYCDLSERLPNINDLEPGDLYERDGVLARRIPTSIAIDAGVIEMRNDNMAEMELMGKRVRDAKYPWPPQPRASRGGEGRERRAPG